MIAKSTELSPISLALPIALLRARESVMERFRPMLLKHGITEQQWRVLRVVQEAGEIDAGELAKNACILGPSLSRIIRTLTAKKYIVLRRDPKDGRRALLSLTGKAEAFIREIAPESAEIYAEIEQRVGRDRVENLLGDINKLLSALAPQEKP